MLVAADGLRLVAAARRVDMSHFTAMSKLLVPLDGSEDSVRAVPVAVRLARRLGLQVQLYRMVGEGTDAATALRSSLPRRRSAFW